jgi:hypothetical protein
MLRLLDELVLFVRRRAPGARGRLAYRALQSVLAPNLARAPVPRRHGQRS